MIEPGRLTQEQTGLFTALTSGEYDNFALVSVIENSTGQQRGVICAVVQDDDGMSNVTPLALLLERDDDAARFTPPGDLDGKDLGMSVDDERLTLSEAAKELGIAPGQLLDFDQSIGGDWEHMFSRAEVEQLRHVMANTDENGVYTEPEDKR